jgi:hypothetical protein
MVEEKEIKIVGGRVFIFMAQAKSKLIQLSKNGKLRSAVVCGQLMERRCEGVEQAAMVMKNITTVAKHANGIVPQLTMPND